MQCGRVYLLVKRGSGDCHHDTVLGHKCKTESDIEAPWWQVEETLINEEIVDHVQHMGCEEHEVELIKSDDDDVEMEPSEMTLVECTEILKDIANFIAQDACLGDEDSLQVQRLANKLLAMQAMCVMNRKQTEINEFFFRWWIFKVTLSRVQVLYSQYWPKHATLLRTYSIYRLC